MRSDFLAHDARAALIFWRCDDVNLATIDAARHGLVASARTNDRPDTRLTQSTQRPPLESACAGV